MSVASLLIPTSTAKSSYPPPSHTQMHPLPLPNTPHPLYHHEAHSSERSPTAAEGASRRKSSTPPVTLAPIEMGGTHLPPPVQYSHGAAQSQPFTPFSQPHSQRYHYPKENDTLAHIYDHRHPSHQPLTSVAAPYDNPHPPALPSRQPQYNPYYTPHNHLQQQRSQSYSPPHPHPAIATGTSHSSHSPRQPPSPQSPDASSPNSFHPHHSFEAHSGSNIEKRRMTPPISPTLPPLPSATPSSEITNASASSISHSFVPSSSSLSASVAPSRNVGTRSGSISLSERINGLTVVAPPATSVHPSIAVATPVSPTIAPESPTSSSLSAPLSLHDRRERNKAASAKYRAKKHVQSSEMRHQIQILQEQNSLISRQLEESRAENASLKTLVEKLKNRIVAQKVLKRLRQVGRDRTSTSTTTSTSSLVSAASSLVPAGGARKHSRHAKVSRAARAGAAGSHAAEVAVDVPMESVVDEDSHDSEIDELEDTLLAQVDDDDDDDDDVFGDNDDDDDFDLGSQMSDDSEYDYRREQPPAKRTKRQRSSSKTNASAPKISSSAFVAGGPPTPRRSSASSTASTESSISSSDVAPAQLSPIVPDIHYE